MIKKSRLFLLIICLVFISGCKIPGECPYSASPYLTSAELAWLYPANKIVVFKNEKGAIDTMGNYLNLVMNPQQEFENRCDIGYQYGFSLLNQAYSEQKKYTFSFQITVSHYYPAYPQNQNSANLDGCKFSDYTPQNNVMINGKSYNGVYIMTLDTTSGTTPTVWKVYYQQGTGILQFNVGTDTWTLQ